MLLIKQFNRFFSVRFLQEYGSPRVIPLEKLQIPRGSIFHTFDLDGVQLAPPTTLPFFKELEKPAQVRHHFQLAQDGIIGRPIKKPVMGQERLIMQYHRQNRFFRRLKTEEIVNRDIKTLLIENYTPILPHYRYPETIMAWYDRLHNFMVTIRDQMKHDAETFPRQNYFVIEIGNQLNSYAQFKNTYSDRTKSKLERFESWSQLWQLELFAWAIGDQDKSIFAGLDINELSRINFILTHAQGFTTINMGVLERFRASSDGKINDEQMARRMYRTFETVMTQAPIQDIETEFVSPHGEDIVVVKDPKEFQESDFDKYDKDEMEKEIARFESLSFDEENEVVVKDPVEDVKPTTIVVEKVINHHENIQKELDKLADSGRLTAKAYAFLKESQTRFVNMPNPYNSNETYGAAIEGALEEVKVEPIVLLDDPTIIESSWAENVTDTMIKQYNKTMLPKDILAAVASSQRMGLVIHDHKIEKEIAATGNLEHHKLRVQMLGDDPVTVNFTIPSINLDGGWTANGVDYTMRRQRVDVPIRKVNFNTVALTTAYGKNFVTRSDRVANDYGRWLNNNIIAEGIDKQNTNIQEPRLANVFDPLEKLPLQYTMISRRVSNFKAVGMAWNFDVHEMPKFFGEEVVDSLKAKDMVPVAKGLGKTVGMDKNSILYTVKGDKIDPMGRLAEVLGFDTTKAPSEISELSLMGKTIPLGFIFSYYLGLQGMLKHFKITHEIIPSGQRVDKLEYDLVIRLADAKIVVMCDTDEQRMMVNGLRPYTKHMRTVTESEMEREDVYLNLLVDADKLTVRYLKELTQMRKGFVDDMHARILRRMKEPETFIGLLERSNQLLTTDHSQPEINGDEMMFLGNQRIAYHLYTALTRSIRNYNNASPSTRRFELSQDMVWGEINSDPSVLVVQGANPIQSIKEKDVITMGGTGGRNRQTMVKHTRAFQESDLGIVSGDTVDNGDVGITSYLSANPQFDTLDGIGKKRDTKKVKIGEAMSFCVGLAPDSLQDDGKRWNFVNIQMGSAMAAEHYEVTPYQTGQGKLVAHRTSSKHARVLEKAATVTEVTEDHVTVRYDDKTEEKFPLGKWFGAHEGKMYPHVLTTKWKKGDKLPARAVVTYNSKHFKPDLYNPFQVNWMNGVNATVVLVEGEPTFEDSCAIDMVISKKLEAEVTKVKEVTIGFAQNILDIIKVGTAVDVDTILCTFSDNMSGDTSGFSSEAAATLSDLQSHAPRAGVRGHIDKIEVFYHGEHEDMSQTVGEVVKRSDRQRKKESVANNGEVAATGSVTGDYRVEGVPLAYQSISIKFYISHIAPMAGGDKQVIANQLKNTVQYVMTGLNEAEDGTPLNIYFGRTSVENRITDSLYTIGTSNFIAVRAGANLHSILFDGADIPLVKA